MTFKRKLFTTGILSIVALGILASLIVIGSKKENEGNAFNRSKLNLNLQKVYESKNEIQVYRSIGIGNSNYYFIGPDPNLILRYNKQLSSQTVVDLKHTTPQSNLGAFEYYANDSIISVVNKNEQLISNYAQSTGLQTKRTKLNAELITRFDWRNERYGVSRGIINGTKRMSFLEIDLLSGNVSKIDNFSSDTTKDFSHDGLLKFDHINNLSVFVHYYDGQITVLDTNLKVQSTFQTVDNTKPLYIESSQVNGKVRSTVPTQLINKDFILGDGGLFVLSNMTASNEKLSDVRNNSAVDVYDVVKGSYKGTIYIPSVDGNKCYTFTEHQDTLTVVYPHKTIVYTISDAL